jgi:hypothetical protein
MKPKDSTMMDDDARGDDLVKKIDELVNQCGEAMADTADFIDVAVDARDRIEALESENARLKHALVVWDQAHRTGRNEPLQVAFEIGKEALIRARGYKT